MHHLPGELSHLDSTTRLNGLVDWTMSMPQSYMDFRYFPLSVVGVLSGTYQTHCHLEHLPPLDYPGLNPGLSYKWIE